MCEELREEAHEGLATHEPVLPHAGLYLLDGELPGVDEPLRGRAVSLQQQRREAQVVRLHDGGVQARKVERRDRNPVVPRVGLEHGGPLVPVPGRVDLDVVHRKPPLLGVARDLRVDLDLLAAGHQIRQTRVAHARHLHNVANPPGGFADEDREVAVHGAVLGDDGALLRVAALELGKHVLVRQVHLVAPGNELVADAAQLVGPHADVALHVEEEVERAGARHVESKQLVFAQRAGAQDHDVQLAPRRQPRAPVEGEDPATLLPHVVKVFVGLEKLLLRVVVEQRAHGVWRRGHSRVGVPRGRDVHVDKVEAVERFRRVPRVPVLFGNGVFLEHRLGGLPLVSRALKGAHRGEGLDAQGTVRHVPKVKPEDVVAHDNVRGALDHHVGKGLQHVALGGARDDLDRLPSFVESHGRRIAKADDRAVNHPLTHNTKAHSDLRELVVGALGPRKLGASLGHALDVEGGDDERCDVGAVERLDAVGTQANLCTERLHKTTLRAPAVHAYPPRGNNAGCVAKHLGQREFVSGHDELGGALYASAVLVTLGTCALPSNFNEPRGKVLGAHDLQHAAPYRLGAATHAHPARLQSGAGRPVKHEAEYAMSHAIAHFNMSVLGVLGVLIRLSAIFPVNLPKHACHCFRRGVNVFALFAAVNSCRHFHVKVRAKLLDDHAGRVTLRSGAKEHDQRWSCKVPLYAGAATPPLQRLGRQARSQ